MDPALQDEVLLACVRDDRDGTLPAQIATVLPLIDQQALLRRAVLHRVAGCVAVALRGLPTLDPQVAMDLSAERRRAAATHLRTTSDLRLVDQTLTGGVPWLAVKGPVLAAHYSRPDVRSFVDLDVLVPPTDLPRALDLLEAAGFATMDANWTLLTQTLSGELHLRTPHGGVLDLHWDLNNDSRTRQSFAMRTASFFERSRQLVVAGRSVPTLDPLDTLVHTAMHAARSGGDRLIWMKDLEQLVLRRDFGWEELAERCVEHRARLPVVIMLQRSQATLQVPLPQGALDRVGGPGGWRALGRAVDRASPVVRAGADGSASRLYARALRGDSRRTLGELARRAVARARRQARSGDQPSPWDAGNPDSRLYPAGGARARAQFLETVARC